MTKRTTTAVLALLPVACGIAACQPTSAQSDSSSRITNTTQSPAGSGAADSSPDCTPVYPDMQGTGITLVNGKVTGAMTLNCTPVPAAGATFSVSIALFYRPSTNVSTTYLSGPSSETYQGTYSVTDSCKPGLWYVGAAINGAPVKGQVIDIADCTQSID